VSYKMPRIAFIATIAVVSSFWMACGSSVDSPVALQVRFAKIQQAVLSSDGLEAEVLGLKINFSRDNTVLIDSDCLAVKANAPERTSMTFDLTPGENTTITVSGYGTVDCSDSPAWKGKSINVVVNEGREVRVPIYVIHRGQRLNPIRSALPAARAFSSASLLSNGQVLVAGGFAEGIKTDNVIKLQAACDAVLYDPGTATFSKPIPLATGCRGLHRALTLNDGRVLLVGGSGSATLDPSGTTRPLLKADSDKLISSAEIFDPSTNSFESLGVSSALLRADAAAVVAGTKIIVLGGRTNLIRSNEIVVRRLDSGDWAVDPVLLVPARSGAQAVLLSKGILVAGGNADNSSTLQLLSSDTLKDLSLSLSSDQSASLKAVSGHTLTPIGSGQPTEALLAGGVYDNIGLGLSNKVFGITWTKPITLNHPRAYHAAETLPDGKVLLAGGFTSNFAATKDLEILDTAILTNTPVVLTENISIGPIGMASARLLDDSVLLVGGLDLTADGGATLSGDAQLFAP
jgi:hypothetical protein